jgi:hypothetical protein
LQHERIRRNNYIFRTANRKAERNKGDDKIWTPKDGEMYYYIEDCFNADCYTWSDDMMDKDLLKANNFFKTQQEAEKYAEHFKQILKNREL